MKLFTRIPKSGALLFAAVLFAGLFCTGCLYGTGAGKADTQTGLHKETEHSIQKLQPQKEPEAEIIYTETDTLSDVMRASFRSETLDAPNLDAVIPKSPDEYRAGPLADEAVPQTAAVSLSLQTSEQSDALLSPDEVISYDAELMQKRSALQTQTILHIQEREEEQARLQEEANRRAAQAVAQKRAEERAALEAKRRREAAEAAKKAACPGYNAAYVATLTEEEQKEAAAFYDQGYVFFRQNWSVTKDLPYGDDGFGQCGCGPTCAAAIIANLAGVPVTPEDMRQYAIEHHSYIPNVGTTYDFLLTVTGAYGIKATNVTSKTAVLNALKAGKLVLVSMGPGDFTLGAHFMLYRGITKEGKILIADSYSYEYSAMEWDWETLESQLKNGYWIFELETKK